MNNQDFAWIAVPDVTPLFALSPNTDAVEFRRYVIDAQQIDLFNLIDSTLYNAIDLAVKANPPQWKQKSYNAGEKVFYNNAYYIANTTTTDTPPSSDWDSYELMNFWYLYVKKWLAGAAMVRYAPYLGLHLTQWGLEQYNQEGFGQVTDKRRAEILNSIKGKTSVFQTKMFDALSDANNTFDGVTYVNTNCRTKRKKLPFTALGAGKYNNIQLTNERRDYL
jgi:hypothetical protein